jgi:hypothetical protein
MFNITAKVQVKNDSGKVVATQDYDKVVFEASGIDAEDKYIQDDVEALLGATIEFFQNEVGEDGNGVLEMLKNVTYSHDLGVRAKIRQTLVATLNGPDKAIAAQVKQYMIGRAAKGKPVTEEEAYKRVMAMMDAD